ncbi:MAG: hypothetical protein QNK37_38785 [Acidobacteriota bacterium]|nr:hypothetical protein [Acidobacteriota bacterium]
MTLFLFLLSQVPFDRCDGMFGLMNQQWHPGCATSTGPKNLVLLSYEKRPKLFSFYDGKLKAEKTLDDQVVSIYANDGILYVATDSNVIIYTLPQLEFRKALDLKVRWFSSHDDVVYGMRRQIDNNYHYPLIFELGGEKFLKRPMGFNQGSQSFSITMHKGTHVVSFSRDQRIFLSDDGAKAIERKRGRSTPGVTPFFSLPETPALKVSSGKAFPTVEDKKWLLLQERHRVPKTLDFQIINDDHFLWVQELPFELNGYIVGTFVKVSHLGKGLEVIREQIGFGQYLGFRNESIIFLHDGTISKSAEQHFGKSLTSLDQLRSIWNPYFSRRTLHPILEIMKIP